MKYRLLFVAAFTAILSACGGSKTSDQPLSDTIDTQKTIDTMEVAATTAPENKVNHYINERFRFSVTVPDGFVAEPDPENGDGRTYKRGGSSIIAYAGYCGSFDEVLALGGGPSDTYVTHKDNWAVWSGVEDGLIYYKKTVFKEGKAYSVYFQYPENEKSEFDSIIKSVLDSWQTGLSKE